MCAQPQNRVLKKLVLYFTREDFVSMPHVDVQHVVARVGPNDRAIAARNRVLQPDRIVLRIKRNQDFDVLVQASTRLPDVPLIRGSTKCRGEPLRNRMSPVINGQLRRQRRPIIPKEHGAAEKIDEPRPARALIVVSGNVEAKPRAAVLHILLKSFSLFRRVRKIVQPDNELHIFKLVGTHVLPVRRGSQREIVFLRKVTVKAQRIQREIDVVLFTLSGVKSESAKWSMLGRLLSGTRRRKEDGDKADDESAKNAGSLPSDRCNVAAWLCSLRSETRDERSKTFAKQGDVLFLHSYRQS